MIPLAWIVFTFIVSYIGTDRKIGGLVAFLVSAFLSPLVGILVVLSSDKLSTIKFQEEALNKSKSLNPASELEKLHALWEKGVITESQYKANKAKILGE